MHAFEWGGFRGFNFMEAEMAEKIEPKDNNANMRNANKGSPAPTDSTTKCRAIAVNK